MGMVSDVHLCGPLCNLQVSLLALNAAAPEDQQSYIVAELVRLVAAAQQLHPNSCLWVVASALLPQAKQQGEG